LLPVTPCIDVAALSKSKDVVGAGDDVDNILERGNLLWSVGNAALLAESKNAVGTLIVGGGVLANDLAVLVLFISIVVEKEANE